MNDDLENFNRLLKGAPIPKPDEDKKKAAIFRAMAAFDEKTSLASQGTARPDRPIGTAWAGFERFLKGAFMTRTRFAIGACAAVIVAISVSLLYNPQVSMPGMGNRAAVYKKFEAEGIRPQLKEAPGPAVSPYFIEQQKLAETARVQNATKSGGSNLPVPVAPPPVANAQDLAAAASIATSSASPPTGVAPRADALVELRSQIEHQNQQIAKTQQPARALTIEPASPMAMRPIMLPPAYPDQGRDKFESITVNPVKVTREEPLSTFSVDTDTSSYSFIRASLGRNRLPPKDSVRIEDMINYFPYDYQAPKDPNEPFKPSIAVFPTPWNPGTKLVAIGIKGYEVPLKEKPRANLVFLIDTSGSMNQPDRLPLVQNALKMLVDTMQDGDTVSIVTYAGAAGVALPPTKIKDKAKIVEVINGLRAYGSTAGSEGLRVAYQLAEQNFDKEGVNRVILSTDGDFNVGITSGDELKAFIAKERDTGIYLSILGVGMGNYNDALMQTLAKNGNGTAAYVDNINEARKLLVQEAGSTVFPIANDVKIQVEFNPAQVAEYRLIGYENRLLKREDFNNDRVKANEIGSGHAVTALYEITPVGSSARSVDDLRYAAKEKAANAGSTSGEYAYLKVRYKLPGSDASKLMSIPIDAESEYAKIDQAPKDARFAASVAGFGQVLRGDAYVNIFSYDDVIALAEAAKGADPFGYRAEFIGLVQLARNAPGARGRE